jgi:hypothetical protein
VGAEHGTHAAATDEVANAIPSLQQPIDGPGGRVHAEFSKLSGERSNDQLDRTII